MTRPVRLRTFEEAVRHFAELAGRRKTKKGDTGGPAVPVVAIGGPTAVGKSTLAGAFRAKAEVVGVPARVLEGDRFLVPQARRPFRARFPDQVYESGRLVSALGDLAAGRTVRVPFYERDGRHTGRLTAGPGAGEAELRTLCAPRMADPSHAIERDEATGDLLEVIAPFHGLWIFDSELSLYYEALQPLYAASYGIRASRARRKRQFVDAVIRGERYPFLSRAEAEAKIEGFWDTDDALIEPTVSRADVQVELDEQS